MRAASSVSSLAVKRFAEVVAPGLSPASARARLEHLADTCIPLRQRTHFGDRRWLTANKEAILVTHDDVVVSVLQVCGDLHREESPTSPRDWSCAEVERRGAHGALLRIGIANHLLSRQSVNDVKRLAKQVDFRIASARPVVADHKEALQALLDLAKAIGVSEYISDVLARERLRLAAKRAR